MHVVPRHVPRPDVLLAVAFHVGHGDDEESPVPVHRRAVVLHGEVEERSGEVAADQPRRRGGRVVSLRRLAHGLVVHVDLRDSNERHAFKRAVGPYLNHI